jgi:hypothetical protein
MRSCSGFAAFVMFFAMRGQQLSHPLHKAG